MQASIHAQRAEPLSVPRSLRVSSKTSPIGLETAELATVPSRRLRAARSSVPFRRARGLCSSTTS